MESFNTEEMEYKYVFNTKKSLKAFFTPEKKEEIKKSCAEILVYKKQNLYHLALMFFGNDESFFKSSLSNNEVLAFSREFSICSIKNRDFDDIEKILKDNLSQNEENQKILKSSLPLLICLIFSIIIIISSWYFNSRRIKIDSEYYFRILNTVPKTFDRWKLKCKTIDPNSWKAKVCLLMRKESPDITKFLHQEKFRPSNNDQNIAWKYWDDNLTVTEQVWDIFILDKNHANLKIRDKNSIRWEFPHEEPFPYKNKIADTNVESSNFEFKLTSKDFTIFRKESKEEIFSLKSLIYNDVYVEMKFDIPSLFLFGLGDRIFNLKLEPGTYTLYTLDQAGALEEKKPGFNTQGHHPMYLMREKSGKYHIFYFRNSNCMEITIKPEGQMIWRAIGGIVDIHFFLGNENPEAAVKMYHQYIGKWAIPPYWSLGHHQNRWGYNSIDQLKEVLDGYKSKKIPLDVLWSDVDVYLREKNGTGKINFELDNERFPFESMKRMLKDYNKKWIIVLDPVVCVHGKQNRALSDPVINHVLLNNTLDSSQKLIIQTFCPGETNEAYLLDFFHPETEGFLHRMLEYMHSKIPFEGIWLDMNEISNLCVYHKIPKWCNDYYKGRKYTKLPFTPGGSNPHEKEILAFDTLHYHQYEEYDVRPFASSLQMKYVYNYLKQKSRMPFILTRANTLGAGKYAAHWMTDTKSDWPYLKKAISYALSLNIFGIPNVGSDLCGFAYFIDQKDGKRSFPSIPGEFCARYYQTAILFPFTRNSHIPVGPGTEVYKFEGKPLEGMIKSIQFRYSILKHYYTQFFLVNGFGTVIRPTFFEFPNDAYLNRIDDNLDIQENFMIGSDLLVMPCLEENIISKKGYIPVEANWYDLRDYKKQVSEKILCPLNDQTPVFLKGGSSIFQQEFSAVNSIEELDNTFKLLIAFQNTQNKFISNGSIINTNNFSDTYIYEKCILESCILKVSAVFEKKLLGYELEIMFSESDKNKINFQLSKIILLGIKEEIKNMRFTEFNFDKNSPRKEIIFDNEGIILNFNQSKFIFGKESSFMVKFY